MIWSTDFAGPVMAGIGGKLTPTTSLNLWSWSAQEKTGLHPAPDDFDWWQWANPLNTEQPWNGSVPMNLPFTVQGYKSIADGCAATVATLLNGRFDTIVESLRENLPAAWWSETARNELSLWGTGSGWCDFTPIGADVMAQLDEILAGVKDIQYALLYGRGTATADPSGFAAADFDGKLDAAVKPVLDAIAKLPGGATPATSAQLTQAVADLKAAIAAVSASLTPTQAQQLQEAHDAVLAAAAGVADVKAHVDQDLK
jgi:hypothetical protein